MAGARGSGWAVWLALISLAAVLSSGVSLAHAGGRAGCTIVGSPGPDHLKGTSRADVICGRGGSDTITGGAGDDVLIGGPGADVLVGGPGKDKLFGGVGKDKLFGGPGADLLSGGLGLNTCPRTDAGDIVRRCRHGGVRRHSTMPPVGPCVFAPASCGNDYVEPDRSPVLNSVGLSPNSGDIAAGPIDLHARVDATHYNPIVAVRLELRGPSGFEREVVLEPKNKLEFEFEGSTELATTSATGTYWIDRVILTDTAGNTTSVGHSELDSAKFGYGQELEVYEGPDSTAPELTEISISPAEVNTDSGPATVKMTIHAKDGLSGVGEIFGAFKMPVAGLNYGFRMPRVSGTAPDGEWVLTIQLPKYAAPGAWALDDLHVHDQAGNDTDYYNPSELETAGFERGFSVVGVGDTTPPQILGLTRTPSVLHAAKGDSKVSFYVHLSDDRSGINLDNIGLSLVIKSVSEPAFSESVVSPGLQTSGNELDGVLQLGTSLPPSAPLGAYEIVSIAARDRAFNLTELSGPALEATGWDLTFENLP